jgi:2-oxoglutarate ferredoxin oxidoreductase subunit beta
MGSIDVPMHPLSIALASEASFVGRGMDIDPNLGSVIERAARHRGTSFVEIYQDCNIFNHGAFAYASNRKTRADNVVYLEHGKPLIFGKDGDLGIRLGADRRPEIVEVSDATAPELLIHDETDESHAFLLSRFTHPKLPEPMGVFYCVEDHCYEDLMIEQIEAAVEEGGEGDLRELLYTGDTYEVE